MRLGIMQPYFFPHLGHFALIAHCDRWVVFDITQYTPKSWMSRNRVLHTGTGWNYVSVPLVNSSIHIRTSEARLLDFHALHSNISGKLSHYRRRAPYYRAITDLLAGVFSTPTDSLVELNCRGLQAVCDYLDIRFDYAVASAMDLPLGNVTHAGGWAPEISSALGASQYLNPIGGCALFDPGEFAERGVELQFLDFIGFEYPTPGFENIPGLSILDVLMWNAPTAIQAAIAANSRIVSAVAVGNAASN